MSFFSSKKKIDMNTTTLSQAIMLKCQSKDFSEKSEAKILTLIYEHIKYNRIEGRCHYNGRSMNVSRGLFCHVMNEAGIMNSEAYHNQQLEEALTKIAGRIYFCQEITKSIAILKNPDFITNGQRRELILVLLLSIKVEENKRLRREIYNLVPVFYPDEIQRPFAQIAAVERQQFASSFETMIVDYVVNNGAVRSPHIKQRRTSGNSLIKNEIENLKNQLASQRFPAFHNLQAQRVRQAPARRNMQIRQKPVLSPQETSRRTELHKQLALLFTHMDKVKDLSPGDKVTVYEFEGEYYTREECMRENIPMDSGPIVLEYMNESEYLNKCNAFKATFTAVLPQIHIMV